MKNIFIFILLLVTSFTNAQPAKQIIKSYVMQPSDVNIQYSGPSRVSKQDTITLPAPQSATKNTPYKITILNAPTSPGDPVSVVIRPHGAGLNRLIDLAVPSIATGPATKIFYTDGNDWFTENAPTSTPQQSFRISGSTGVSFIEIPNVTNYSQGYVYRIKTYRALTFLIKGFNTNFDNNAPFTGKTVNGQKGAVVEYTLYGTKWILTSLQIF